MGNHPRGCKSPECPVCSDYTLGTGFNVAYAASFPNTPTYPQVTYISSGDMDILLKDLEIIKDGINQEKMCKLLDEILKKLNKKVKQKKAKRKK